MRTEPTMVNRVRSAYERARRPLAWVLMVITVLLVYYHDVLDASGIQVWPLTLGAFALINFETLSQVAERTLVRPATEYRTMNDAIEQICGLVKLEHRRLDIKIIALSGHSTVSNLLPRILEARATDSTAVELWVVNTSGPLAEYLPSHLAAERPDVLRRVNALCAQAGVGLIIREYDYLPCVHGITINDTHLFLGYAGWGKKRADPEFTAADRPHRYYAKTHVGAKHFFYLFNDWCTHAPKRLVIP